MLTANDTKVLKGFSNKLFFLGIAVISLGILSSIYSTYFDLNLVINYGRQMGYDTTGIFTMWNQEPDLQRNYTGYEHMSLIRLNNAIFSLGGVVINSLFLWLVISSRARNKRILSVLKKCGEL